MGSQLHPKFHAASTTSTPSDDVTGEDGDREMGGGDDGAVGGVPRRGGGGGRAERGVPRRGGGDN